MCEMGMMDAASYTMKERSLSEALVLLDKREVRIFVLCLYLDRRDPYPHHLGASGILNAA
jgi:hypothetical protein